MAASKSTSAVKPSRSSSTTAAYVVVLSVLVAALSVSSVRAFVVPPTTAGRASRGAGAPNLGAYKPRSSGRLAPATILLEASSSDEAAEDATAEEAPALAAAATNALPPAAPLADEILTSSSSSSSTASTTTFMITSEMRRVLVEELRYTRSEVDSLRVEMAGSIIEQRISRPEGGMPESWRAPQDDGGMLGRLERESRYPLKVPLLGISLVLGGKGLGDALITLIKVNTGFPGASLAETFMGANVLAIDVLCVLAGIGLGTWTWKTMRD